MMRAAVALALLMGAAQAQYYPPSDTASFPPRHADNFLAETDCGGGTVAGTGSGDFVGTISGTAASLSAMSTNSLGTSTGYCQFNTGSTATGRAALSLGWSASTAGNPGPIDFANGTAKFFAALNEGTASNGTDTYTVYAGFFDSMSATPIDGCFFRYTHGTNSGKWEKVARANSVETATAIDTGLTFTATTRRTFGIVATSTSCAFYNAGALLGSVITSNIPTGSTRTTSAGVYVQKSLGATDTAPILLDYIAIEQRPATARGWAPF